MFIPARDYGNINVLAPLGPDTGVSLSPPIRFQEPFYDRGYPCSLNSRYDATLVRRSIMLSLHSGSIWPPWYKRDSETAFSIQVHMATVVRVQRTRVTCANPASPFEISVALEGGGTPAILVEQRTRQDTCYPELKLYRLSSSFPFHFPWNIFSFKQKERNKLVQNNLSVE